MPAAPLTPDEASRQEPLRALRWVPVAFWIALLGLIAIGVDLGRNLSEAKSLASQRLQVRQLLLEHKHLIIALKDAQIAVQCLALSGNSNCVSHYTSALADLDRGLSTIERLWQSVNMPVLQPPQLRPLLAEHRVALDSAVDAYRSGGPKATLPFMRTGDSDQLSDAVTALIEREVGSIESLLDKRVRHSNDNLASALNGLLAGGTLSVVVLLFGFRRLGREVRERGQLAAQLAGTNASIERQVRERTASLLSANAALRASEAFVRGIGDNLPGGMIYQMTLNTDEHASFQYVSAGVERIHGVSALAVLDNANTLLSQIVEEDRPLWLAQHAVADSTDRAFSFDLRLSRPDGGVRWCSVTSSRRLLPDGRMLVVGIELDITDRKHAEADNEQLLKRVSDGVFSLDADWRFTHLDPKVAETFSRSREALMGRNIFDEFPVFVRTKFHSACHEALLEQRFQESEDYNPAIDRWFECRIYPSHDGVTVFARDVTESKRADRAMREHDARLQLALEASNIGLWEWKPGTDEVYYSPLLKRQMGYEDHEIANRADTWQSHIHPEDLAMTRAKVGASTHSPWPRYENEYRLRHKDGRYRWIRATGAMLLGENGQPLRLLGTLQDITELRQVQAERERLLSDQLSARAAASAANERLVHVLESVSDAVVALDRDWRYVFVNPQAARIFGRRSHELIGKHLWTEFPERVGQPYHQAYLKAMQEQTFVFLEEYSPSQQRWYDNRIYPSAEGISLFFHDITDRKRAEAALRTTEAQLHELLAQRQRAQEAERIRISRQIHDEMGQLLTGLKMDLRWLERKLAEPDVPPRFNALLDRAVAASALNDETLAAVQRIAAELRPTTLDQLGLTAALTQAARQFTARSGIQCLVQGSLDELTLPIAIASELFYISQEALTNVARHAAAQAVHIELNAQEGCVMLDIRDDGVGIDLAKIDGRHSLGLLGMRERALQCGATLQVRRIEPRGTCVSVRIPRSSLNHGAQA